MFVLFFRHLAQHLDRPLVLGVVLGDTFNGALGLSHRLGCVGPQLQNVDRLSVEYHGVVVQGIRRLDKPLVIRCLLGLQLPQRIRHLAHGELALDRVRLDCNLVQARLGRCRRHASTSWRDDLNAPAHWRHRSSLWRSRSSHACIPSVRHWRPRGRVRNLAPDYHS